MLKRAIPFFLVALLGATLALAAPVINPAGPAITVTPEKSNGVYQPGEKIVWDVKITDDPDASIKEASYVVKEGGLMETAKGKITFTNGLATIETSLSEPATAVTEVTAVGPDKTVVKALGGAAVSPDLIKRSAPCPGDFDAFWKTKLDELAAIPANPILTKEDSGQPGIEYWKITLDNIHGTHIQGQLARPAGIQKLPALLIVQWAGVYPLKKSWAVDRAAQGWLTLNIMAHDLPIDQPREYYDNLAQGALNNYTAIGDDDREKSYFLRMFLACHQAAQYLEHRPDWDGKTIVVTGGSQGGMQSFFTAAMDPKITAMVVLVPAGCDDTGLKAGRMPGWPCWRNDKQAMDTSRYFDTVNFAARVNCPALIGLGLIDSTAPPSGIFAAVNQMKAPKELVIMPNSEHTEKNNSQAPYHARAEVWLHSLSTTGAPPPPLP